MKKKTLILHDDPLIYDTVMDFIPSVDCFVGDYLEYETLVGAESLDRYRELKAENSVNRIVEREVILSRASETLVLYLTSKPAG